MKVYIGISSEGRSKPAVFSTYEKAKSYYLDHGFVFSNVTREFCLPHTPTRITVVEAEIS